MKKLSILFIALILAQGLSAQFYYNHSKSDRLIELMLTITESDLKESRSLSMEADKALKMLAEETDTSVAFADYVSDDIVFFIKVLSEEQVEEDVIFALKGMEKVWTNAEDQSLVNACLRKKIVGASYIDMRDRYDGEDFGVLLIFFR